MEKNISANNATVVADENQNAVEATASKYTFTTLKGDKKAYDSLDHLFRKGKKDEDAARAERKTLFGSWLAEVKEGEKIDPEALTKKIAEKEAELKHYLSNLAKLKELAEGLVAQNKAKALADSVGEMTDAEVEMLLKAIENRKNG